MIKKILGLAPKLTADGSYSPSPLSLKLATSKVTDYQKVDFPHKGHGKILVVCSEESRVPTANGKYFSSGNHPVETLVPMLHLQNAGFDFEILTLTGRPVQFEMWAMPEDDQHVMALYQQYLPNFSNPGSLREWVNGQGDQVGDYVAIYFPGGHGALMGLPESEDVGKLIHWAVNNDLFVLAICHGPAALLAAAKSGQAYPFEAYKLAAFPDSVDRQTPLIGYMPGQLTWFFGEKLKSLGVEIVNSGADKSCFADRKLISGASPKAANDFGMLCAKSLLNAMDEGSRPIKK